MFASPTVSPAFHPPLGSVSPKDWVGVSIRLPPSFVITYVRMDENVFNLFKICQYFPLAVTKLNKFGF